MKKKLLFVFLPVILMVVSFFGHLFYLHFFKVPKINITERTVYHDLEPSEESKFVDEYPVDGFELIKVILLEVQSSEVAPEMIKNVILENAKESGADIVFESSSSHKEVIHFVSFLGKQKKQGVTVSQTRFFLFKKI